MLMVVGALVARRQYLRPLWEPRGADWGMWFASAAWPFHDVQWPPVRWPLWGFSAAFLDQLSPAPLHVDAMLLSMLCTGLAGAATFAVVRPLAGITAAVCGVALLLLHPMTLEIGGWLGGYSMLAMTGPLVAAALASATRGRTASWWVAGAAFAVCLAVQEKGIVNAIGMVPAFVVAIALQFRARGGREAARSVWRVGAPVAVLALAYFLFPGPMASLDAQATLQNEGHAAPPPAMVMIDKSKPMEQPASPTATTGWIFGRQMGPMTILGLAEKGLAPPTKETSAVHAAKLRFVLAESFPGADKRVVGIFVAAGLLAFLAAFAQGVRARRWDAMVAVVALVGVVASAFPSLHSDFNLRFLVAPGWALPALLASGLGAAGRWVVAGTSAARWTGPAAAALGTLLMVGPYRKGSTWSWDDCPIFAKAEPNEHLAGQIWLDLEKGWPGVPIDVQSPFSGGALAVEGREGRYLSGLDLSIEPATPSHWLILPAPMGRETVGAPAATLGLLGDDGRAVNLGARRIAAVWPGGGSSAIVLLTPDAPP